MPLSSTVLSWLSLCVVCYEVSIASELYLLQGCTLFLCILQECMCILPGLNSLLFGSPSGSKKCPTGAYNMICNALMLCS